MPRLQHPTLSGFPLCCLIVAGLTLIRLVGLRYSLTDLYFDESQYWVWSREFAFGYFSKPPLLAWTIAIAESICGSGEACIRSPSPILHAGTALLVLLHRARTLRRAGRVLVLPGDRVRQRRRVLLAHHLDRCAVYLSVVAGAARLSETPARAEPRLGRRAWPRDRVRAAGEIRHGLFLPVRRARRVVSRAGARDRQAP